VASRSNFSSSASIARKKPSTEAALRNAGTLNTGWYGSGNRLRANMPITPEIEPKRMVSSKVTTMNDTHELSGLPPMLSG
jgi:hypothetical protein